MKISTPYLVAGAAVATALVWAMSKGAKGAGVAIGSAAVDAVDGLMSGAVVSIGQVAGIPDTNKTECQKAKDAGDSWGASFACPAGEFISYMWE